MSSLSEQLVICPCCGSNACSEISNEIVTIWIYMTCGKTANTTIVEENVETMEETLPELYKALRFKDISGKYWYPNSVVLPDNSMVFAEGTTADDWKWSAVKSKDNKADMSTKQEFGELEFMDALEYIGYFEMSK